MVMAIRGLLKYLFEKAGYHVSSKQFMTDADYLRQLVNANRENEVVIFDVGANVGNYTARMLEIVSSASIYCFEPFDSSFNQLSNRFASQVLVRPARLALADFIGEKNFYVNSAFSETNSLLKPASLEQASVVQVACTTIDAVAKLYNLNTIHVLKIDVQGAELAVLKGATAMLSSKKIDLIRVEVIFDRLYDEQSFFGETLKYLNAHGYKFSGFIEPVYNNNIMLWSDAIFVK